MMPVGDRPRKGARFLNVAALDKPISVRPTHKANWGFNDLLRLQVVDKFGD